MRIGIDIDGVVLDFERVMRNYAEMYDLLVLNKKGIVNNKEFSYLKRYDWTKEEKDFFIKNYLVYGTIRTPLLPGCKEGLDFLKLLGNELIAITQRGKLNSDTIKAVSQRLKEEKITFNKILWKIDNKLSVCQTEKIDLMIDDNPDTCELLSKNGIKTLYFRDKDGKKLVENEFLIEVNNWGEICRIVKGLIVNDATNDYSKILLS